MHQVMRNWRKADLSDRHRAMLEFVEKLTVNPSGVTRADMDALLAAGFSERDYYDIVLVAAQFNFMDRIADGLGVELDRIYVRFLEAVNEEPVLQPPATA